jgi:hypothetical protein
MAKKQVINATPNVAAEFTKLFGPPPLFKTEDNAIYNAILEGLAQDEKPRSFIARVLLRDVADLVYQRLWLGGLGTRLIRQAHKEKLQVSAKIAKIEADMFRKTIHYNHARLSVKPKADVPNANKSESGADKSESEAEKAKAELDKIDATIDAVMKENLTQLRKAEDGPVDEAALFPMWIEKYERIQSLLAAVDKKLSDTLKLLDEYRHGLGHRVRQVADEIVDVEFEEDPLAAREQQVALEGKVPSTQEMLSPPVVALR